MTVGSPISPEMILVLLLLVLLQLPGPRRLAHLAAHDPLTGLANRTLFADRLERALARARREGRPGALLLLDLDGFKAVNDARGHAAGDRALAAVADRLRGCVREVDTVARLGGDEFAVVLDGVEAAAEAHRVAGRIGAALAEPLRLDGDGDDDDGGGVPLTLGASIGVAVFAGREVPADLLRRADGVMYAAKRAGSRRPAGAGGGRRGPAPRATTAGGVRRRAVPGAEGSATAGGSGCPTPIPAATRRRIEGICCVGRLKARGIGLLGLEERLDTASRPRPRANWCSTSSAPSPPSSGG